MTEALHHDQVPPQRYILSFTMKNLILFVAAVFVCNVTSLAQAPAKAVVFAVLDNGATLEPIGYLENRKLESAIDGGQELEVLQDFHRRYFKPRTTYQLVFGGSKAGTVTVKSADPSSECARHTAEVTVTSQRARLRGNVMALAVSNSLKLSGNGVRRTPTAAERAEIEALVRADLSKKGVKAAVLKKLQYQNLTAIDADGDGVVEFVGSYWVAPTAKSRSLLFFIADKNSTGKYAMSVTDHKALTEDETMSSDITTVDSGVGHELLLDLFDVDNDGKSEVFTYSQSFEGAGFNVYRKEGGKWTKVHDSANYRCAF